MSGNGWTTTTFADLIEAGRLQIGDGYRAKNDELGGDGVIFLRAGHVSDTGIDFNGTERFHSHLTERVTGKMARPGDAVITTKGNSTGRVAYIREDMPPFVYSPHLSYWRSCDPKVILPRFLYYWSRTEEFQTQLRGMSASTDMAPYLSLTDQRRLRISLPPPPLQKVVVETLGSMDDRIELNRQMNETMEAMARTLFRAWFVDFDPVRAKAEGRPPEGLDAKTADLFPDSFDDSPLGSIPKGWRAGTLGEVAVNPRRGVDADTITPGTAYIGLDHMPRKSIALAEWDDDPEVESNKFRFSRGEVLFGKLRPYFHKVGVAPVDGVCSTDILVIAPASPEWFVFTLCHFSSDELVRHADSTSTGTKMPRTNWSDLAAYKVVLPEVETVRQFQRMAAPLIDKIMAGIAESRTLAATRDALLPKLLSGEVKVGDAAPTLVGKA